MLKRQMQAEKCGCTHIIEEEYFYGFSSREIKEVKKIVTENIELLKSAWNEYFEQ